MVEWGVVTGCTRLVLNPCMDWDRRRQAPEIDTSTKNDRSPLVWFVLF